MNEYARPNDVAVARYSTFGFCSVKMVQAFADIWRVCHYGGQMRRHEK